MKKQMKVKQARMSQRAARGLERSIKKWENVIIQVALDPDFKRIDVEEGMNDCPLCKLYHPQADDRWKIRILAPAARLQVHAACYLDLQAKYDRLLETERRLEQETIERCAKVAEELRSGDIGRSYGDVSQGDCADAIRALKTARFLVSLRET